MLVINATFYCKEGTREEFLTKVKEAGIDMASRAEELNYKYDFYLAVDDPNALLLVEKWKDSDAHAYHRTLPHYLKLSEIKADYVYDSVTEKYFVD